MSISQVNITLGTAGHIDHGKTALVKSLTGCETDRLKEEKERGMSIDLGYAPCTIDDVQVGIVDVPGHENFVKTMVAGASGMDGVILVVAADDGVMPQTREHLDILTLLGIQHGLVALTKIDRVARERRELVQRELIDLVQGTFLENAPILPLSNITWEGFDPFLKALAALVQSIPPKRTDGVFRVPLDRAFSAKGYGTVVAGIPIAGEARVGDELVLLPQNELGRLKRIEVYGRDSDTVKAGQCAALNVGHWDHRAIRRGDVVTLPSYFAPATWYAAQLRLLPHEKLVLKNGAAVKFHTGTSEVNATLYSPDGAPMYGGNDYFVQFRLDRPVVAGPGDRFIVRTLAPVRTAGGGTILEATARRLKRNRPEVGQRLLEQAQSLGDETRFVACCLRQIETLAASEVDLAARAKVPRHRLPAILARLVEQRQVLVLGTGLYIHSETAAAVADRVLGVLRDFHRQSPESPGMTIEPLRQAVPIDKAVLDGLVAWMKSQGRLVERNQRLAAPEHQPTLDDEDSKLVEAVEEVFRQQAFHPPSPDELAASIKAPRAAIDRAIRILGEHRRLVCIGEGLWFHDEALARARQILVDYLRQEGRLESVRFKYLLDTTRKFALPLLDYFDRVGLLRRSGNTRFLREK